MAKGFTLPRHREPTHPGEMLLEEFLKPMGLSQREFARRIGWTPAEVSNLVNKKAGLSPARALDLADAFGVSAEFWMNCQACWELWHALRAHTPKERILEAS